MNRLRQILERMAHQLDECGQQWALIGGLAVSARSEPRFTRDIDVAVAIPSDDEAEKLVFHLQRRGYSLFQLVEQRDVGRLATARLIPPDESEDGIVVDLLFSSSGIENEVVIESDLLELMPHCVVPVAQSGHLIALKLLSRDPKFRPDDDADIRKLIAIADTTQLELARAAVELIEERKYHRGRDLTRSLDEMLARYRS